MIGEEIFQPEGDHADLRRLRERAVVRGIVYGAGAEIATRLDGSGNKRSGWWLGDEFLGGTIAEAAEAIERG